MCSAAVKPFEFAALPLERVSRDGKFVLCLQYVYGVRVVSSAFFAMEVVRKGSPLETTECDEKEIQGNSAVPRPLLPSAMARPPPDTCF